MVRLLVICAGLFLTGCQSRGTSDAGNSRPVTDKKELSDLAGTWYATEDTYTMLAEKKYPRDSIYIVLRNDSVFNAFHLPDCMDAANKGGLLLDAVGTWRLHKNGDAWRLLMGFEKGRLFRYKTYSEFDIQVTDSVLTLLRIVGDPEEKDILRFRKKL